MGFINNFINNSQENEVRKMTRDLYKTMYSSFAKSKDKFSDKTSDSEHFRLILIHRPYWTKADGETFEYARFGEVKLIEITGNESFVESVKKVAAAEIMVAAKRLSTERQEQLLTIGLDELGKYIDNDATPVVAQS